VQAARTLGLDPSTVTRLADRIVAAGHAARGTDPRHRGVVTLTLTASGRDLVAAAGAWRQRELARIMARLAPAGQEAVTAGLGLLVSAAGDDCGITAPPCTAMRPGCGASDEALAGGTLSGRAGGRALVQREAL
jgi:hypothetical protein